ncbi:MAG TPA: SagB family peptide dehydrogenase [Blastocatellia bacterium]|jgi:oxazoline/thiazoline dehydrogenase|nr:SagB family peptide dehydrogenase [Blastocatellia bacterium]
MLDLQATYRLSRHLIIRPGLNSFVLETPLDSGKLLLAKSSVFKLLLALSKPTRLIDLLTAVEESQRTKLREFLDQCYERHLLTLVLEDGRAEEDLNSLAHWEFHDLVFHTYSRPTRHNQPFGATYRFRGLLPEEPCFKPSEENGDLLPLPKPDLEALKLEDMPLTLALENRRSLHGLEPISFDNLGEFLYRTCRVTGTSSDGIGMEVIRKVYPSGGSLHPLEVYLVANRCLGLERGMYRYRAADHALAYIQTLDTDVEKFLSDASRACGGLPDYPPVLLIIAARFRRTAWKYQSIAYHVTLMEAGTLLQTMYLVATAMRLAPCALGSGDSDHFARVAGTDYYLETSIGEFILGRTPAEPST